MGTMINRRNIFLHLLAEHEIYRFYVLATTFRSGSTLFGKLLSMQTNLDFHIEKFKMLPTWYYLEEAALQKQIRRALSPVKNGCFATKMMWPHRNNLASFLNITKSESSDFLNILPNCKFVHLKRSDKVAQAVSFFIARQTGMWGETSTESNSNVRNLSYSFNSIHYYFLLLNSNDLLWTEFFKLIGVNVHIIYYEELLNDYQDAVKKCLHDLNLHYVESKFSNFSINKYEKTPMQSEFENRFAEDLYSYSPLEFLPNRLVGPPTP